MKLIVALICVVLICPHVFAEEVERADTTFQIFSDWTLELDPEDQPYPDYIADPRRPRMNLGIGIADSEIPDTSSGRIMFDAGTRYTMFKVLTDPQGINEFALDVEAGLFTQFDPGNSLDNIGWDGQYAVFAVYDWSDTIVVRTGIRHISSHLGDEYMKVTGRQRVNYTREALVLGICYLLNDGYTFYVEPNWAWSMGNELRQDRWAINSGFQYQGPYDMWNSSMAFYGGTHVRMFQEDSWSPGISAQCGYVIKRHKRSTSFRLGMEGYYGRAILGEFSLDYDEAYLTMNFMYDFY